MSTLTESVEDVLAALEFEKACMRCPSRNRESTATCVAWISHCTFLHRPDDGFICGTCRQELEAAIITNLGYTCICGFKMAGQLSDNFRAVAL